jgi:hypothetical protein
VKESTPEEAKNLGVRRKMDKIQKVQENKEELINTAICCSKRRVTLGSQQTLLLF